MIPKMEGIHKDLPLFMIFSSLLLYLCAFSSLNVYLCSLSLCLALFTCFKIIYCFYTLRFIYCFPYLL